jgi:hypothetical protein
VVLEVFRVRQRFEQAAALVERDFGLPVVTYPRPCFGFLGEELYCDAVVRGYLGASAGCCDDSVVIPGGEVDPCAHLMRPRDNLAVVCFHAGRQGRLACGLRGMPVPRVVLDAPHEQRHPPGENEDLAVLPEGDALPFRGAPQAQRTASGLTMVAAVCCCRKIKKAGSWNWNRPVSWWAILGSNQ